MGWSVYARLSLMMFLEFAVWGAWAPVLFPYLDDMGFSGTEIGWIFSLLWLGCILSPFIGGQIADRYMPTQFFLAAVHLLGGVFMFVLAYAEGYWAIFVLMFIYSMLYAPTLALVNSISFHHLTDVDKQFGWIRVWGTIGWIAAGVGLTAWRYLQGDNLIKNDLLLMSGGLSVLLGFVCLTLPHTPPKREATNPLAFLEALKMLKDPVFGVFLLISFVVTTELQFYYLPTAQFLEDIGVEKASVPAVMTIAQVAEIITMAGILFWLLPKIGIRWALAIGVIAWPLRYIVFAIGEPTSLVIASLALHGVGYTFFFVVSQIYVDKVAPIDIRASAQALLTLVTLGIGNFLGTLFTGVVMDFLKEGDQYRWTPIFLVPCALTVICAIAFLLFFRERQGKIDVS